MRKTLFCTLAIVATLGLVACQSKTATDAPVATPTKEAVAESVATSTPEPTAEPTLEPTATSTPKPTSTPTPEPTSTPTPEPTISVEASSGLAKYKLEGDTLTFYDGELVTEELILGALEEYEIGDYDVNKVVIEEGILSIGENAFAYWGMENLELPDSVTSIGNRAFLGCTGLTSLKLPKSLTSIGESAFTSCYSLAEVEFPDGLTSIGAEAFSYSGITSIELPNSVTSIGESAFSNCPKLTKVTFPDSVTSIGEDAFTYEPELYNISPGSIAVSAPVGSYAESWAKENYYMALSADTAESVE